MPSLENHKIKYTQNKALLAKELNIETCQNYDWMITIMFYTALHLVEGELAKTSVHTKTHTDRHTMINRNTVFRNIKAKYKTLHDRSIAARYSGKVATKTKAEYCMQLLEDIEKEITI